MKKNLVGRSRRASSALKLTGVLLILAACSTTQRAAWATVYRDSLRGFSITLPQNWTRKVPATPGTILKLTIGEDTTSSVFIVSAVKLAARETVGIITPASILAILQDSTLDPMRFAKRNIRVVEIESTDVGGLQSVLAETRFEYVSFSGRRLPIRKLEYYCLRRGYFLTFGAELVYIDQHLQDFRQMMSTVRFDGVPPSKPH